MKNKKIMKLLVLLVGLLLITGCTSDEKAEEDAGKYPIKLKDASGKEIIIKEKPMKIASLSLNNTEILFELGLDEEIVGVTKFCEYPEEALSKEKVRDLDNVDVEKIKELGVDLVVEYSNGSGKVREELEDAGITVLSFAPKTIEEVADTIKTLGLATGKTDEGQKIYEDMMERYKRVAGLTKDSEKIKVFYEEWANPLITAGKGTMVEYIIEEAGGINIGSEAGKDYPEFSLEKLVEVNPAVYIAKYEDDNTIEGIIERKGYEKIDAIKEYDVHLIDPALVTIPGPRIIDGLELVFEAINPELAFESE